MNNPKEILQQEKLQTAFPVVKLYQTILQEMREPLALSARLKKKRLTEWLQIANTQLFQSEKTDELCKHWSSVADSIVTEAFYHFFEHDEVALFAMGKWGSFELNLSSDIDLILVHKAGAQISISKFRQFQNLLSSRDSQGFLFRTDFDLRPGGKSSPMIPSDDEFINYYTNFGETWEKMALTRLRPICGNQNVIDKICTFKEQFCFQRHLDFNLLDDLSSLREKIQFEHWAKSDNEKINLKFIPGGIRDIELFIHALQIIHGGKSKNLRISGITKSCQQMIDQGILSSSDGQTISENYWRLRTLENYVQLINDEQTHTFDIKAQHPDAIFKKWDELDLKATNEIVSKILGKPPGAKEMNFIDRALLELGDHKDILFQLMTISLKSRNKDRDELQKQKLILKYLEIIFQQNHHIKNSLSLMQDFLNSVKTRTSFLTLLLREENLLKKMAYLFSYSPYLSGILIRRPELLDSFVYQSQDVQTDDIQNILEFLLEKKLLSELSNGIELLESLNLEKVSHQLSIVADSIVLKLLEWHNKEHQSNLNVLCLGKWGGQELGFNSDLDFIFITKDEVTENDLKAARRIINRLTETNKGGSLYSIDMRLKPSGKAGPLVIQFSQLLQYLKTSAEAWERQAYTRSRLLISEMNLLLELQETLNERSISTQEMKQLKSIQDELIKTSKGELDLKLSSGGLLQIELFIQTFLLQISLINLKETSTKGMIRIAKEQTSQIEINELEKRYALFRLVEQIQQLISREQGSSLDTNSESYQLLAAALKMPPFELKLALQSSFLSTKDDLLKLDPRESAR